MYAEDGNEVRVLTRGLPSGESRHDPGTGMPGISRVGWTPDGGSGAWARALEGADAVINLSGESLASKRWSAQAKKQFRDSRILATRSLAAAIKAAAVPPALLISGSAVGIYGPSDDCTLTERDAPGTGFLRRSYASSGSKRRFKPSEPARVLSSCEPESCSSVRAVRCRR